ncbi:MAG: hypothetical protein RMM98_10900 [Acidobacteriota bacterium]|nr:hypothetical protein [Blastocatellia bacterium]MDW8240115.1 hypothetical protein [Acidobacteriota bacterium]
MPSHRGDSSIDRQSFGAVEPEAAGRYNQAVVSIIDRVVEGGAVYER